MKKLFILMFVLLVSVKLAAQSDKVFHTYIYNDEFKVYMDINLYENNVIVPDQELFGEIPGYFGAKRDQRKWLITSAKIDGKNSATLEIVNDYGSEDLTATLTYNPEDGSYVLKQKSGSRIKIVVNRKWVKIPAQLPMSIEYQYITSSLGNIWETF